MVEGLCDAGRLEQIATSWSEGAAAESLPADRLFSIWEITAWILPMAPEHLRRTLAAHPALPQGQTGSEGGTRWFSASELVVLRHHFTQGARKARYVSPRNPAGAPLIVLAQPQGGMGKTVMTLHLATAAALAGLRVLVIDGDPCGRLAADLGVAPGTASLLPLLARGAGGHLRQINEGRLDRGEAPLPMEARLSRALQPVAAPLIFPSRWPGLDVLPAGPDLMQADLVIGGWQRSLPRWQPRRALAEAIQADGLRNRYDLIFCDTGRGLGPLAMTLLTVADILLSPLPPDGVPGLAAGLGALATATRDMDASDQITAQALGQVHHPVTWRRLAILPTCLAVGTPFPRTAAAILPAALPEIEPVRTGKARQLYAVDYRSIGRVAYAPLRDAVEAAARVVMAMAAEA